MTEAKQSGDADFDRARALLAGKREDEALDRFELATERATEPAVRASASAHVAALLLGFRRPWEVAEFTGRLRQAGGDEALAALLDASACIQLGDATGALQLLGAEGTVAAPRDNWYPCSQAAVWAVRVRALHLAGRDADAVAQLLHALATDPAAAPLWEATATLVADDVLAPADALAHLRPADVPSLFGWIAGAPVAGVDRLAEALWERYGGSTSVLAAATLFAWLLDADDALRWSVRLAAAGVACSPVHDRAERPAVAACERVRAAIVGALLDADRSRATLAAALPLVTGADLLELFDLCVERAGILADTFVVAAATDTERCLLLAGELVRRGNHDEGFAVLVAGLSLPSADDLTRDTFAHLLPRHERDTLAGVAQRRGHAEVVGILASVSTPPGRPPAHSEDSPS